MNEIPNTHRHTHTCHVHVRKRRAAAAHKPAHTPLSRHEIYSILLPRPSMCHHHMLSSSFHVCTVPKEGQQSNHRTQTIQRGGTGLHHGHRLPSAVPISTSRGFPGQTTVRRLHEMAGWPAGAAPTLRSQETPSFATRLHLLLQHHLHLPYPPPLLPRACSPSHSTASRPPR